MDPGMLSTHPLATLINLPFELGHCSELAAVTVSARELWSGCV